MKNIKTLKSILYFTFAFIVLAYLVLAVMLKQILVFADFELSSFYINLLRVVFVALALLHMWGYTKILTYISKDF